MDPPYETDAVSPALAGLLSCEALAEGARVVIEHSRREPIAQPMGKLALTDQRRFGKTLVSFMDFVL
jgi:16S rRNA (guanine966-N2)-methyltransferase